MSVTASPNMYKGSVVVFEDEENMCRILSKFLNMEGYHVTTFVNPRQGLEYIAQYSPDIVITDIRMPELDGFEVLKRVKTLDPRIIVLVVTAYGTIDGAVDAMREGAFHYIQKPFSLNELLAQVDKAIEKFGFAMGPFRMSDLAGNDISWHIRKRHYAEHPQQRQMRIADRVCELGRFGQKTGLGWYRYEAGKRDALPDPVVDDIIKEERAALKIAPRKVADTEIVDRLVYALVNEGARILEEGIAQRASDIDIVYLFGYGFPVQRGGPMFHASRVGLKQVLRRMKEFAAK